MNKRVWKKTVWKKHPVSHLLIDGTFREMRWKVRLYHEWQLQDFRQPIAYREAGTYIIRRLIEERVIPAI